MLWVGNSFPFSKVTKGWIFLYLAKFNIKQIEPGDGVKKNGFFYLYAVSCTIFQLKPNPNKSHLTYN